MNRPAFQVILAAPADRDFLEIMEWSAERFGAAAADRYELLVRQALTDVGEDPFRPGARQRPELRQGMYTYHLAASRDRVNGDRVSAPRYFLLYRVLAFRVEVLRILHDNRDLERHLPEMR